MRVFIKLFTLAAILAVAGVATAEALVVRRPVAPGPTVVRGAGAPGVGVRPGVGAGAAGVGVRPGVGAGAPGPGLTVRGPAGVGR